MRFHILFINVFKKTFQLKSIQIEINSRFTIIVIIFDDYNRLNKRYHDIHDNFVIKFKNIFFESINVDSKKTRFVIFF